MNEKKALSHLGEDGKPRMVDVSTKSVTFRKAIAQCFVDVPDIVYSHLCDNQNNKKNKGSVFQVATLAGIMAAKETSRLIPLCHNLFLSKVDVDIQWLNSNRITITCTTKTKSSTGVEMEALTGVSIAALTVYDMCKALSHDVVITEIKLISKSGGKSNFKR